MKTVYCEPNTNPSQVDARFTWVDKLTAHVLILLDILYTSRLFHLLEGVPAQAVILGSCATIILIYTVATLWAGHIYQPLSVLLLIGLIGYQMHVFSSLAGVPININSGFQYIWMGTFIVFFYMASRGNLAYYVDMLFLYSTAYAILYIVLSLAISLQALPISSDSLLLLDDDARGQRVYIYGAAVAFAGYCWLSRLQIAFSYRSGLMLFLCGYALYLGQSRVFTAIFLLLSVLFVLRATISIIRIISFGFLATSCVLAVYGILDSAWNPFAYFISDNSGLARAWEFSIARQFLINNLIFGLGVSPSVDEAWLFLKSEYFFPADLGPIGVWLELGLIGFLIFLLVCYTNCAPIINPDIPFRWPLFLIGCLLCLYGCIAPNILSGAGALYSALIFGIHLNDLKRLRVNARA